MHLIRNYKENISCINWMFLLGVRNWSEGNSMFITKTEVTEANERPIIRKLHIISYDHHRPTQKTQLLHHLFAGWWGLWIPPSVISIRPHLIRSHHNTITFLHQEETEFEPMTHYCPILLVRGVTCNLMIKHKQAYITI